MDMRNHFKNTWRVVWLTTLAVLISSCSVIDEGEIDYARTIAKQSQFSNGDGTCDDGSYQSSLATPAAIARPCYETLYRKYVASPAIEKNQTISLHLMQGFIDSSTESQSLTEFLSGKASNAEVVIIANVCEQGVPGCSLSFGPSADKTGRVVYFSNGVKAKQYLNFSYLPVYGPIKYQGGPLIVKLTIIELDSLSEQEVGLINTLAEAGKKAYPPASKVLSVLDSLGQSLLQSNTDDVTFRYTMTLTPGTGNNDYANPIISAGNYAFIKKRTVAGEQEEEPFQGISFDHLTGRLVEQCEPEELIAQTSINSDGEQVFNAKTACSIDEAKGIGYKDYRGNTYLTFQVQTGFSERTLDNVQSFEMLLTEINNAKDEDVTAAVDAVKKLGEYFSRSVKSQQLNSQLAQMTREANNRHYYRYDALKLVAQSFADTYVNHFNGYLEHCITTPVAKCKDELTAAQLTTAKLNARQILSSLDATNIDSSFPLALATAKITDSTAKRDVFVEAYKRSFQKRVFESAWGEVNQLETLNAHVARLGAEVVNDKSKPLQQRYQRAYKRLNNHVANYLYRFRRHIDIYKVNKCSATPKDIACYQVPSTSSLKQLGALTDGFLTQATKTPKKMANNFLVDGILINDIQNVILDLKHQP